MAVWDIAERPVEDQFGYWHDVICAVFVPMTPRRTIAGDGFPSWVEARSLGTMERMLTCSQPQQTVHGPREVSVSTEGFYFVNLQLAGRYQVRQGGRETVVSPGQFVVLDTTEPYYFDFDSRWQMLSFRVPHELLSSRLANPRQGTVVSIDGARGLGGVASGLMRSLWELDEPVSAAASIELEQSFASVISVAMGAAGDQDESLHDGLRAGVLRFVAANLGDPALSVATVCRKFAISPRLLHKLFEHQEQTFAETVRTMRLQQCARLLADPANSATITEIALRHGFTDSTSFSRAFRRQFGLAPRQMREHVQVDQIAPPRKVADGS